MEPRRDIGWEVREYVRRCLRYDETIQYRTDHKGTKIVDCYGEHARGLKARELQDQPDLAL